MSNDERAICDLLDAFTHAIYLKDSSGAIIAPLWTAVMAPSAADMATAADNILSHAIFRGRTYIEVAASTPGRFGGATPSCERRVEV
jgi:hypothetical protein